MIAAKPKSWFRLYLERAWWVATTASTLLSLGIGTAVSAVVASLVDMASPWRWFFFVGMLIATAAATMPAARWLMLKLPNTQQLPVSAIPNRALEPPVPEARSTHADDERERRRKRRAAAHEVLAVLEVHRADIERWTRAQNPEYRGEWLVNRALLAEEPAYDAAIHATERALNGVGYFVGDAALTPVVEAIEALKKVLENDRDLQF